VKLRLKPSSEERDAGLRRSFTGALSLFPSLFRICR
jgi:hypothetical protein